LTAPEQAEFERWLGSDSRNAASWRDLQAAWAAFDRPRRWGAAGAMELELRVRWRRRFRARIGAAAAAVAAAAGAWVFVARPSGSHPALADATASPVILRAERRVLPDQSVVELNQGAQIAVNFRPDRRDIRLVKGEAHFAVAKNPARPFVVTAGNVQVRAVGTEFSVKLGAQNTDLLVTEGKVSVERAAYDLGPGERAGERGARASAPILVPAGGLLVVPASGMNPAHSALEVQILPASEIERRLEWRQPCVELSGTPLGEAVGIFNREARIHLSVGDPKLAKLRMSGVFRADNADGFVRLLQANYRVKVERRGDELILHLAR
jgi:transmembrane sensor